MKTTKTPSPTKSFPFKGVKKSGLVPVEQYYMQLQKPRDQVSKLQGTFVKYHTENDTSHRTYAVFKNVVILNKKYKLGTCRRMLVRSLELLVNTECDSYSDPMKNRTVNANREVYLDVGYWKFGRPTEKAILTKRIFQKLPDDMEREIETFTGTKEPLPEGKKGGKNKRKTLKRTNKHNLE